MSKKKVDKETQARVRKYLEYVMESQRLNKSQDESILSDLSDNLRGELLTQVNGKVLKEVSMFTTYYSSKFLIALSTCLKEKTYSPEEIIFNVCIPPSKLFVKGKLTRKGSLVRVCILL